MLNLFNVTIASRRLRFVGLLIAAVLAVPLGAQSPTRAPESHHDLQGTWNSTRIAGVIRPKLTSRRRITMRGTTAERKLSVRNARRSSSIHRTAGFRR